jgi:hypothetical protein
MDTMTSTEFRRRYATLTEPTMVTVLGRPIGIWNPHFVEAVAAERGHQVATYGRSFSSRPFTPVPKGK